jgi:hypothetical protein
VQAGADPKSVQAQMRHFRISTTLDIYAQVVPEAQRQAFRKLSAFAGNCDQNVTNRDQKAPAGSPQVVERLVELVGIEPTTSSLRIQKTK